jgi:hypothetical protein
MKKSLLCKEYNCITIRASRALNQIRLLLLSMFFFLFLFFFFFLFFCLEIMIEWYFTSPDLLFSEKVMAKIRI